jgi:hypothetical protein
MLQLVDRRISGESTRSLYSFEGSISKYQVSTPDCDAVTKAFYECTFRNYGLVDARPPDPRILSFCANVVALLPDLEEAILRSIAVLSPERNAAHRKFVEEESARRVTDSQRREYNPSLVRYNMLARANFNNRGF